MVSSDEQGHRVASCRVAQTPAACADLTTFLHQRRGAAPAPQELAGLMETTQGLLITALRAAGWAVSRVTPQTVDRRRKPSGAKTDALDASRLATTGRSDLADRRRRTPESPLVPELKARTRDQDTLIQTQTRLVKQLTACRTACLTACLTAYLKASYPVALTLFPQRQHPLTRAVLQSSATLEAARGTSVKERAVLLRQPHHPTPEATAPAIDDRGHQPPVEADPLTTRTKSRLLLALVSPLAPLLEQIKQYAAERTGRFLSHPDSGIGSSLPRAGQRLAPRLLAGGGDERER